MPIDHAALGTELDGDPVAVGYPPLRIAENWTGLATLLNAPRAGAKLSAGVVPSHRVVNAIVKAAYDALSAADKNYLTFVLARPEVDVGPGEVRQALAALFPAGSATRGNLLALVDRPASRAEELFGADVVVRHEDVIRAVRGSL